METQKIILTIVASLLAIDLIVLFLIPIIRKQIKDNTDSIYNEFMDVIKLQKQNLDTITLLRSDMNIRIREERQSTQDLFDKFDLVHSKINEVKSLCNDFGRVSTDLSETIRKERIEYYQLKEKFRLVASSSQNNILQAQYDAVCRERDELKKELDKKKTKQVLTDDRKANKLLAQKIEKDKLTAPLPKGYLKDLLEPNLKDLIEPKKKRKYSYHAYNTPERMKELRRLKALKKNSEPKKNILVQKLKDKLKLDAMVDVSLIKRGRPKKKTTEPIVIVKNKVGRPKGSKNKFN
jgi:hypothetical protein